MSDTDQRHLTRDSLFVMAALRVAGIDKDFKVKVRNLSPGGLMAEGGPKVVRGMPVSVELRNLGQVDGVVAWVQDTRFGIAFDTPIDPKAARLAAAPETPLYRPLSAAAARRQVDVAQPLRKV
ncbi:MAG TPA: PilZ domain-containing protein [Novosphingobium sp.]|nr:PilZ domain-containing protein [Novosphingobium sp.]